MKHTHAPGAMAGVILTNAEKTWELFVAMQCKGCSLGEDPQNFVRVIALIVEHRMPPMFPKVIGDYLWSLYNSQREKFRDDLQRALGKCELESNSKGLVNDLIQDLFEPSIYNMVTTYGFHRRLWACRN